MAQRARKPHQKSASLIVHSGVNEKLHEVGMDVSDPAIWGRADLDLVLDLPKMAWDSVLGRGVDRPTKYHIRMSDTTLCLCTNSGRVVADLPWGSLSLFLQRVNSRIQTEYEPPIRPSSKLVSIASGKGFAASAS